METTLNYSGDNFAQLCAIIDARPATICHRFEKGGARFYYWRDEQGVVQIGSGITSVIGKVMPESVYLTEWKLNHGKDWKKVLNIAADYGTLFHLVVLYWQNQQDFAPTMEQARKFCSQNGMPEDMIDKDLLSYIRLVEDYNIKPLLMEAMLVSPTIHGNKFAMTIDMLCEIDKEDVKEIQDGVLASGKNKGMPKMVKQKTIRRTLALIDFKSNSFGKDTKSFYDAHKYQLMGAKRAIKHNFGMDVECLMNFSPNNWRTEPTYTLKEWNITEHDNWMFDTYMAIASKQGLFMPSGSKLVIENFETSRGFKYLTYQEYATEKLMAPVKTDMTHDEIEAALRGDHEEPEAIAEKFGDTDVVHVKLPQMEDKNFLEAVGASHKPIPGVEGQLIVSGAKNTLGSRDRAPADVNGTYIQG